MGTERFSMNWPRRVSRRVPAIVLTCVSLAVTSCAAPQAPRDASSAAAPVRQAPKVLVVAVPQEPAQLEGFLGASGVGGGGIVKRVQIRFAGHSGHDRQFNRLCRVSGPRVVGLPGRVTIRRRI